MLLEELDREGWLPVTPGSVPDLMGNEPSWFEQAPCRETDPEIFFPEKGQSPEPAKKICRGCDVRRECLEYALSGNEGYGVWGGLTDRERRNLMRRAA